MNKAGLTKTSSIFLAICLVAFAGCAPKQKAEQQEPPIAHHPSPSTVHQQDGLVLEEITIAGSKSSRRHYKRKNRRVQSVRQSHRSHQSKPVTSYYQTPAHDQSHYPEFNDNPIKLTAQEPVSTFSIDVDTSAYSVMRSYLRRGVLPPAAAIRTEELLNYFSYDYAIPDSKQQPFKPHINVFPSPWSETKQLIRIGIKGYDIQATEQPDSNIVFLLDVSGSMSAPNKLPLVKQSMRLLLKSLKPTDTVSIVVYAGASGVALEATPVSDDEVILQALNRLYASGGTAGGAGIKLAYSIAKKNFKENGVNRIFLATDGDFNVGLSSNESLQQLVEAKRKQGIYLSVLGFGGRNYQDDMMQAIAQNGNGIAAYIDTLQEAKKVLVDEATSSLFPIANDVKIQVEFNPANVSEYRLLGYETRKLKREDFNNDKVDAGEIGAGHNVTALYEITPADTAHTSIDPLRYAAEHKKETPVSAKQFNDELGFLKIRYKLPKEKKSALLELPIEKTLGSDSDALFASSVAAFAEILKDSKYQNGFTIDEVIALAKANKGEDDDGYRAEFIQLVESAKLLKDI